MFESILAFLSSKVGLWLLGIIGVGSVSAILDKLMKKFVTNDLLKKVHDFFAYYIALPGDWLGLALNSAGTKLPILGKMWNKTIEPWVIILLDTIVGGVLDGVAELLRRVIKALQSDNPSTK